MEVLVKVKPVAEGLNRGDDPRDELFARTEKAIFLLVPAFVLPQEALKIMEQHPVEDRALRMASTIDARHIGRADSKSVPETYRRRPPG
jgi:hypothetical protein